jgi:hypothetical protein
VTDEITFEDGRVCELGSSPFSWVLTDVAGFVSPEFALWLRDVTDRPLMGFDLRGLPAHYRNEFYTGLQRAFSTRMADPQMRDKLGQSRHLGAFLALLTTYKRSRRRLPPQNSNDVFRADWPIEPVSIRDLWFCPSCREYFDGHPVSRCGKCGWEYPFAT